jgi:hypothetical protein
MKPLAIIFCLLSFAVLVPCVSSAGETNAEMNAVIRAIHTDFLKLNGKYASFSDYSDNCLMESERGLMISYLLPEKNAMGIASINNRPQQPDQIAISYINVNQTNGFKYWNEFENVAECRFPSLKFKIYGEVLIRDESNAKLKELVMQIVETECAKEQEAIKAAAKQN